MSLSDERDIPFTRSRSPFHVIVISLLGDCDIHQSIMIRAHHRDIDKPYVAHAIAMLPQHCIISPFLLGISRPISSDDERWPGVADSEFELGG
jgi:hypothetical protein